MSGGVDVGSTGITAAYVGSTALSKVYVGATEAWSAGGGGGGGGGGTGPLAEIQAIPVTNISGNSGSASFTSNVTSGNTVIVAGAVFGAPLTYTAMTAPTLGGSAVTGAYPVFSNSGIGFIGNPASPGGIAIFMWVLPNCPGGQKTIALACASSIYTFAAREYDGLHTNPVVAQSNNNGGGGSTTTYDSGSITTSVSSVIVAYSCAYGHNQNADAPNPPWTSTEASGFSVDSFLVKPAGTYQWTGTNTAGAFTWAGIAAITP